MSLIEVSRYLSFVLRHRPDQAGVELDAHGWARVDELIEGVSKKHPITMEMLEEIVRTDDKMRYSFNEGRTLIRANQGHSVEVDVELSELDPPDVLYHGTAEKYVGFIEREGLIPKSRLYVHLSADYDTAVKVGQRHGEVVVYYVDCRSMRRDGYRFFLSKNGVWLTKSVPALYLKRAKM